MTFQPVTKFWKDLVQEIHTCGTWFSKGDVLLPPLTVDGQPLLFPLTPEACRQLIQTAQPAPFGRGTETVIDEAVRRAWQVDASRVSFAPPGDKILAAFTKELQEKMALPPIELVLYKLLVYEAGGHFKAHRDTLRGDRHIGSVIVSLPVQHGSHCVGGELTVSGPGPLSVHVERWDGQTAGFLSSYAAFFTDCLHELQPVESGYRVSLAFEIHHCPRPSSTCAAETVPAVVVSEDWVERCKRFISAALSRNRDTLVIPLLHKYGDIKSSNAIVSQLKGVDLILYQIVLKEFRDQCKIQVKNFPIVHEVYNSEGCYGEANYSFDRQRIEQVLEHDPYVMDNTDGTIYDLLIKKRKRETKTGRPLPSLPESDEDWISERKTWFLYSRNTIFLCDHTSTEQKEYRPSVETMGNEAAPEMRLYRNVCLKLQLKAATPPPSPSYYGDGEVRHYWTTPWMMTGEGVFQEEQEVDEDEEDE